MKNVKEISLAAKQWHIKGTEQLNDMNSTITFINEKFVGRDKGEIKSLRKESSYLTKRLEEIGAGLDRQEQCSRLNYLLIHGVDEMDGENAMNYL